MKGFALARLRQWLRAEEADERRIAPRNEDPEIVVYYWDGSPPVGRRLRDISPTGAFVYTAERWYPGTILRIVLQKWSPLPAQAGTGAPEVSTCIPARVVRSGSDGTAFEFAFSNDEEAAAFGNFLASIQDGREKSAPGNATAAPLQPRRNGQALIEFALMVPLIFLLAVNAVNFGGFIFAWITVAGAARAGADYMIMSSASPGAPTAATSAQVTTLVTSDMTSLLNRSSLVVATCTNATTAANSCTSYYDPEAPAYTLATVDVTYTYNPYISVFSFPALHISATLPSTTVHRKAVMRMMQ